MPPVDFPVNFVATPDADIPVYITVELDVYELPHNLYCQVYSWDKNGEPAPFIHFYWRCILPIRKN